jgi:hypothetical protein
VHTSPFLALYTLCSNISNLGLRPSAHFSIKLISYTHEYLIATCVILHFKWALAKGCGNSTQITDLFLWLDALQQLTFGGHKRTPETELSALKMRMKLDTLQQPTF